MKVDVGKVSNHMIRGNCTPEEWWWLFQCYL